MTAPDLTPEQRELSEADHDALVDTICLALPQPHRGTCNRVADAVAPTVARMLADARAEAWDEGHRLTAPHSDRCEPTCPNPYRAALAQATTPEEPT